MNDFQLNKFYKHGDSKGGHPSYLYDKDDESGELYAILFTHSKRKNTIKLKHNIDPKDPRDCYARKNPIVDFVKSFSKKNKYNNYEINEEDEDTINKIKRKKSPKKGKKSDPRIHKFK